MTEIILEKNLEEEILAALEDVKDPEIPFISVVELGIITAVEIDDDKVKVKMIPTFTACPAIKLMQQQIRDRVLAMDYKNVEVVIDPTIAWSSDRVSEAGIKKLEKFGLGTAHRHGGEFSFEDLSQSNCPHCGSNNTTMQSLFGSTLCRSMHFCFDCKQGFERFKPL